MGGRPNRRNKAAFLKFLRRSVDRASTKQDQTESVNKLSHAQLAFSIHSSCSYAFVRFFELLLISGQIDKL